MAFGSRARKGNVIKLTTFSQSTQKKKESPYDLKKVKCDHGSNCKNFLKKSRSYAFTEEKTNVQEGI